MGLDIYAGPLSRYYARDWETAAQKAGRAMGTHVHVIRAEEPTDAITDPQQARLITEAWRDGLASTLRQHGVILDWDEDPKQGYFTNKPAWDCYGALLLWAAYLEHPEMTRPSRCPDEWHQDPALRASCAAGFETRFPHLLRETEFWLPADFDFTFGAESPAGDVVTCGSSYRLRHELAEINRTSWNGSTDDREQWIREGSDYGAPLEIGARFCCALMLDLSESAVRSRLPMKLDY